MAVLRVGTDRRGSDPVPRAGEIARGSYWSIVRAGDEYQLCYLSGELLGREKRLTLHEREAREIAEGKVPVELYLAEGIALPAPTQVPEPATMTGTFQQKVLPQPD